MDFQAVAKHTVFLNPRNNMAPTTIPSEIRSDPLTGRTARICHFMKLKWPKPDFDRLITGTEINCPFCKNNVMRVTPCFPPDILPEGRLIRGDMVLFPNMAPYDTISAVATLGAEHFILMTDITPERIVSGFSLAMTFFRRIQDLNHPEAVYFMINWNFMPPAGSSLIHPHLQVFCTSSPLNLMREELTASKSYYQRHGTVYWDDLTGHEKQAGQRFLGTIGRTSWLTAYAPLGVAGDVLAVVDGVNCTLGLTEQDLADLALGLTKTMAAYDRLGLYSFNMSFFTGAPTDDFARFHLLFSPRTFFNQTLGATDVGALRQMNNESICMAFPEEINAMIKECFD